MKLGLDYDGVITDQPEMFSAMSHLYLAANHEVHVITGNRGTPEFMANLEKTGIVFSHFFSIADYLYEQGAAVTGFDENRPWFAENLWNKTKGGYCCRNQISFHIDDSEIYGQFFTTPYLLYNRKTNVSTFQEFQP